MEKRTMLFIVWVVAMVCIMHSAKEKADWAVGNFSQYQEDAKDAALDARDTISSTAYDSTRDALVEGKEKAYNKYEDANSKVHEAYKYAKDTMTEQAKEKYEAAKEKASDAVGNLGQNMRTGSAEL